MSLDGIVTRALTYELRDKLVGGRISKIHQPETDEIIMNIYNKGENYKLLLSANSSHPRIHFTNLQKDNPQEPPTFCMVLRKHLSGSTILDVSQFDMDRIIFIDISSLDELGIAKEKRLVIEIMGRHSNIILIDKNSKKIIDSITKVSFDMSRVRQILPGLIYETPPSQDKLNPLDINFDIFNNKLKEAPDKQEIFKFFYMNFTGMSPLVSREICFRAGVDIKKVIASLEENELDILFKNFQLVMNDIKENNYKPILVEKEEGGYKAFYCLELKQFSNLNIIEKDSISELLDLYYTRNDQLDRIEQKSHAIKKSIQTKLDRTLNKLAKQREEFLETKDREKYKVYADLISANLHSIKERGLDSITVSNFYSKDMEDITIPLDHRFDPNQNAQRYYKKYSRLKNGEQLLKKQIPETEDEISYLENILLSLENSTEISDLEDIREELVAGGYIKKKKTKKKKKSTSRPHHYISSEGYNIYVGKNNRQNDELTLKFANKNDIWLHVQNMPGSHVIIRNDHGEISDKLLEEAAMLAAYYSSARQSSNVPIDYTEKKNVKKPSGAKPGMVIYEDFNTIFVTPTKSFIHSLKTI